MLLHRLSRSTLQAVLVGAAALGAVALMPAPEARAACIGGNSVCTTFDPSSVSNVQNAIGFSGNYTQPVYPLDQARILFDLSGYAGPGFTISSITVSSSSNSFNPLSFGSLAVVNGANSSSQNRTAFSALSVALSSYDLSDLRISMVLPGSSVINIGTAITAQINLQDSSDPGLGSITTVNDFTTIASSGSPVPGPLPLLGAAAAFGFSRKIRRRISRAS